MAPGGPAPHGASISEMSTANEIRRRLGVLVTRFADVRATADEGTALLTRHLGLLLAGATPRNLATVLPRRVGFGSRVQVQDVATGERITHHLMCSEAMDIDAQHVSLDSPVGRALLGRAAGQVVKVETPRGTRRLRIIALQSLPDLLNVLDRREDDQLVGVAR